MLKMTINPAPTQIAIYEKLKERRKEGYSKSELAEMLGKTHNGIKTALYEMRRKGEAFCIALPNWARWYGTEQERDSAMNGAHERRDRDTRITHAHLYNRKPKAPRPPKEPKHAKVAKVKPAKKEMLLRRPDYRLDKKGKSGPKTAYAVVWPKHVKIQVIEHEASPYEVRGPILGAFVTEWVQLRSGGGE